MKPKANKALIQKRFRRAGAGYNDAAVVQQQMANKLVSRLLDISGSCYPLALETGAGSGLLTNLLHKKLNIDTLHANDIIEECPAALKSLISSGWLTYLAGDAEQLTKPEKPYNLIISNAAIQWFDHPLDTLNRWIDWLAPNGLLAFTTFGPEHFKALSLTINSGLDYLHSQTIITSLLAKAECLWFDESLERLQFASFIDLLRHLKATGVNALKPRHWSKSDMTFYAGRYRASGPDDKTYTLTYHPYWFIFRKRGIN